MKTTIIISTTGDDYTISETNSNMYINDDIYCC